MALMGEAALVDHTFRGYKFGWRVTMLAMLVTSAAGALLALHHFGVDLPKLWYTLIAA